MGGSSVDWSWYVCVVFYNLWHREADFSFKRADTWTRPTTEHISNSSALNLECIIFELTILLWNVAQIGEPRPT